MVSRTRRRGEQVNALVPYAAGKSYVVTGANGGIGREIALGLARGGAARVVLACRNPVKAADAQRDIATRAGVDLSRLPIVPLDLADLASVRAAAQSLATLGPFDAVVNNAGLVLSDRQLSADGFELTMATNHLGPYLLTRLLIDDPTALAHDARIVNVSSVAHWSAVRGFAFDDPFAERRYSGWGQYGRSKLANILFTRALATRLRGTARTTNSLHPGYVRSAFGGEGDMAGMQGKLVGVHTPLQIEPEKGAYTALYCTLAPELKTTSGEYFVRSRLGRLAPWAKRDNDAQQLWDLSAAWTGVAP